MRGGRKLDARDGGVNDRNFPAGLGALLGGLLALAAGSAHAREEPLIRIGQAIEGELARGDQVQADGSFSDTYIFDGKAGQIVIVEMSSTDLDSYVGLFAEGASPIAYNDDARRRSRDARLNHVLPADGRYRIVVNSVDPGEQGRYRLTLKAGAPTRPTRPRARPIRTAKPVQGELGPGSGRAADDTSYDLYTFKGEVGETVRLSLTATDFDGFLSIHLPGREADLAFARSRGRETELTFTPARTGLYEVRANTAVSGEAGRYSLRLDREATRPATPRMIGYGDTVRAELTASDPKAYDNSFYDPYRFKAARGDEVTITMRSPMVDSFLSVRSAQEGRELASAADDGAGGLDAELTFVAPSDGMYEVWANTMGANQRGAYVLSIERIGKDAALVAATPPRAGAKRPS